MLVKYRYFKDLFKSDVLYIVDKIDTHTDVGVLNVRANVSDKGCPAGATGDKIIPLFMPMKHGLVSTRYQVTKELVNQLI